MLLRLEINGKRKNHHNLDLIELLRKEGFTYGRKESKKQKDKRKKGRRSV